MKTVNDYESLKNEEIVWQFAGSVGAVLLWFLRKNWSIMFTSVESLWCVVKPSQVLHVAVHQKRFVETSFMKNSPLAPFRICAGLA